MAFDLSDFLSRFGTNISQAGGSALTGGPIETAKPEDDASKKDNQLDTSGTVPDNYKFPSYFDSLKGVSPLKPEEQHQEQANPAEYNKQLVDLNQQAPLKPEFHQPKVGSTVNIEEPMEITGSPIKPKPPVGAPVPTAEEIIAKSATPTPAQPQGESELEAAQRARREAEQGSQLAMAGEKFLQGANKAKGGEYKADTTIPEMIRREGELPLKQIEEKQAYTAAQQKLTKGKLELDNETKMSDPTSQESIMYRAELLKLDPSKAKIPNFDKMTATQISNLMPMMDKRIAMADKKDIANARNEELKLKWAELANTKGVNLDTKRKELLMKTGLAADKEFDNNNKDKKSALASAESGLKEMITNEPGHPSNLIALNKIGASLSVLFGMKRVTLEGMRSMITSPQLSRSFEDWTQGKLQGTPSPDTVRDISNVLKRVKDDMDNEKHQLFRDKSNITAKTLGIPADDVYQMLDPDPSTKYLQSQQQNIPTGTVKVQAPDGKIKLIPQNQLQQALQAGGKQV